MGALAHYSNKQTIAGLLIAHHKDDKSDYSLLFPLSTLKTSRP